ncbi:MAG: fibronectin type III domain-containing protein, partial [Bacteroidales bacterium]|nr:fibronectin type III domain-containing protein [Bacteroidales bacterium]
MKNFTLCSLLHKSHLSRQMKSAASLFAVVLLLLCGNVNAQNLKYYNSGSTSYQDYVVTGQAYQSIASTGTALYTTLGVPSTSTVKSFSLPFEFQYGTKHMAAGSTVYVNPSRGYVAMGTNYGNNYQYGNPSYDGTYYAKYCLSPCGGFGNSSPLSQSDPDFYYAMSIDNSGIFYTIQGTAPARVAIIEFHNVMFYYDYSQVGDNSSYYTNFQVKLYEGTDKIEFCYGPRSNSISYTGNYYPFTFLMGDNYNDNIYLYGSNDAKWEKPTVDHYTSTNTTSTTYSHYLNNSGTIWTNGLTYVFNPAMPTDLTADFSDPLQTKLSWNASAFGETEWTIEYGTSGFTPGTGTTFTTNNNVDWNVPDLVDGSYDFYVYAYNDKGVFGDANLTSATNKITFDFACRTDLLTETENFNQYSIVLPIGCWYDIADASNVVIAKTTINEIEEKVLKLDGTNGGITVISGDLDNLLDGHVIYFDIASANAGESVEVGYYDNGSFTPVKTVSTLRSDMFDQVAVDMSGAVGSILAFRNTNNNIVYIDNLYAKVKGSECDEDVPTGLFATAAASYDATVTWLGTAANYELIYGATGFDPDQEGTLVQNISGLTYTITGLPEGTYDCYVRATCSGNGNSAWSKVSTFAIACTVNTLLDENFDNRIPEQVDNCWKSLEDPNKAVIATISAQDTLFGDGIQTPFGYSGSAQTYNAGPGKYRFQVW